VVVNKCRADNIWCVRSMTSVLYGRSDVRTLDITTSELATLLEAVSNAGGKTISWPCTTFIGRDHLLLANGRSLDRGSSSDDVAIAPSPYLTPVPQPNSKGLFAARAELQFANSSVNSRIEIHVLRTNRALNVLV